jgi:hypothetical protein
MKNNFNSEISPQRTQRAAEKTASNPLFLRLLWARNISRREKELKEKFSVAFCASLCPLWANSSKLRHYAYLNL